MSFWTQLEAAESARSAQWLDAEPAECQTCHEVKRGVLFRHLYRVLQGVGVRPMSHTYNIDDEREAAIVAWRLRCLEAAGMEPLDASVLAMRRDIDRVEVERALKAGASSAQARGIFL